MLRNTLLCSLIIQWSHWSRSEEPMGSISQGCQLSSSILNSQQTNCLHCQLFSPKMTKRKSFNGVKHLEMCIANSSMNKCLSFMSRTLDLMHFLKGIMKGTQWSLLVLMLHFKRKSKIVTYNSRLGSLMGKMRKRKITKGFKRRWKILKTK